MKTSAVQRDRNRANRSELRSALRRLRAETSKEKAAEQLQVVTRLLDRAAGSGLIHRKNANRNKSRLTRFVGTLA
jgi:small subunit ribosomal protein S20